MVIRCSDEMEKEFRERMRDGNGTATIKNLFRQGELRGKARLVAEISLPPGASIGAHRHDNEEEIFYFISGSGRVNDNGVSRDVKAGDAMLTGDGASHSVENTGSEPLVFLATILLYS